MKLKKIKEKLKKVQNLSKLNPVAKFGWRFNKSGVFQDKTKKIERHRKHKNVVE